MQFGWHNIYLTEITDTENIADSLRSTKLLFDADGRLDLSYTA